MGIFASAARRWIDAHLVTIGVAFLLVGTLLTVFNSLRHALSIPYIDVTSNASVSLAGLTINLMSELAGPLVYNSVFLIAIGVLLRSWRVTLIGFESTPAAQIVVSGPDDDNVVWLGKKYASALDADLAANALAKRLMRVDS
jgi:hypothetical protein